MTTTKRVLSFDVGIRHLSLSLIAYAFDDYPKVAKVPHDADYKTELEIEPEDNSWRGLRVEAWEVIDLLQLDAIPTKPDELKKDYRKRQRKQRQEKSRIINLVPLLMDTLQQRIALVERPVDAIVVEQQMRGKMVGIAHVLF